MKSILTTIITVLLFQFSNAQEIDTIPRKSINIIRVVEAPKIDGILDDTAWVNAPIATNFVERMPTNGKPIPDSLQTRVKIVYDDLGIYFGATLDDPNIQNIPKELTERDNIGNDDFFFILLNGYNDRQQSLQFIITAAGVQYDAKMTNNNEDSSWNGVWYSAVQINKSDWVVEVFIPYSELRFPKKNIQEWGLNMEREYRRSGARYTWSPVDNSKGSYSIYDGEIQGIENINTPTRLSFQPYFSTYVNNYDGDTELNVNGGMDLKYGISDAFTLDMILIPDFGQTKFDEAVLNLSAFETQYNEQRAFFTEGTELFSKGNLFYSRRVGGTPSRTPILSENEIVESLPPTVDLINALKISGRTDQGLGIGFFNAFTKKTYATIKNTLTGDSRKEVIEPPTNYNILVLDQRFGENSSVSFVNTNTTRDKDFRNSNASGFYLDLNNNRNTMNYWANAEGSWVMEDETKFGTEGELGIAKTNGKNRASLEMNYRSKDYDINDLGYSGLANYINYLGHYSYRYLQPKGFLNNLSLNFNVFHQRRLEPDLFSDLVLNFNSSFTTKDFFNFGFGFETTPIGTQDIYEPRVDGRYLKVPSYYNQWVYFNTDYRKKLKFAASIDWYKYAEKGRGELEIDLDPSFQVSDKFKIFLSTNISLSDKEEGFVNFEDNNIVIGARDRSTIVNSLESRYIFNNKMALNLALRHYYTEVQYDKFFNLDPDGELLLRSNYENNYDATYNSWNLDLRFSWWFAPGSQVSLLYRNAVDSYIDASKLNFSNNFNMLFEQPQLNSLSLRVTYYLDYNRLKNWFKNDKPVTTQVISVNKYGKL